MRNAGGARDEIAAMIHDTRGAAKRKFCRDIQERARAELLPGIMSCLIDPGMNVLL